jgi:digeranylgeranylglycerophospholipid reductase
MHDLVVIGAGPVGSYLASLCADNMNVLVVEEDKEAGGKACSGLVSPRLMEMLPSSVKRTGLIQHTVKGAVVHFMGREFEFRKSGDAAYVLDRDVLDGRLAGHAKGSGADIMLGERVLGITASRHKVSVKTARHLFEAKVAAGCDGARSVAAKTIGSKPSELLNGLIIYTEKEDYSDTVEMWFDKSLVKDGFFWRMPRGRQTEFGCIGYGLSFPVLERFFGIDKGSVSGRNAAPVPIGIARTYGTRIVLVGDAACQTKPWSGGGITYGMVAAGYASEVISGAVRRNDFSRLSVYEDLWKKRLLRDMKAGLLVREFYKDLDLRGLAGIMERAESMKHECDKIDFDFPFSSMLIG